MRVLQKWQLVGKRQDKDKIPYHDIDIHLVPIIRLFNKLPWLATTSCCEGHPTQRSLLMIDKMNNSEGDWIATGGISFEIYDEEKWHALIGLFDKENKEDYEYFNIGICRGYHYSKQGFIYYSWGMSWSTQGLIKEGCIKRLESVWCKLEYYLRKYLELEEKGINWEKYLKHEE